MIKFEDIQKANETIKTTGIERRNKDGTVTVNEYAEVNQRIKAFRMCFPMGKITTEIVYQGNGIVLMKATCEDGNGNILGTGYAQEKENSSFINKTSHIENCETSAVGRALGMCGFGIDTSVASYEEVQNAIANQQNAQKSEPKTELMATANQVALIYQQMHPQRIESMLNHYRKNKIEHLTLKEASEVLDTLKKEKEQHGTNHGQRQ